MAAAFLSTLATQAGRALTTRRLRNPSMRYLSFDDVDAHAEGFDAMVAVSGLRDPFCSSTDWIVPARAAFFDEALPRVLELDNGWAPLMGLDTVLGRTIMPMEASWGLAAPIISPDRSLAAAEVVDALLADRASWDALYLSGLERQGPDFRQLVRRLVGKLELGLGRATLRCVASLEGGRDGWLGRRTPRFRKNLRRVRRRGSEVSFEWIDTATPTEAVAIFERVLAIERLSWKAREGHGIDQGAMCAFYQAMVPRLAARGALRVTFAQLEGRDVGYVLGGLMAGSYRGLQVSFDSTLAQLSLGNLLQFETVGRLTDEGVHTYDLGTDMAYKRNWAESVVETVPLIGR